MALDWAHEVQDENISRALHFVIGGWDWYSVWSNAEDPAANLS
jgi:hypothetical protein